MEYIISIQIQTPTFVSCNNCDLWLPVEYLHCCTKSIDPILYNHNISWNLI